MRSVVSFVLLICCFASQGQTISDALLFGQDQKLGTARFMSMSGAFGTLGGNSSSAIINPAGIGVYRRGELGLSYGISSQGLSTSHYGSTSNDMLNASKLTNFTLVFSNPLYESDWKKFNVMFSYNRRNNFDSQYTYEGVNQESSKLDRYLFDILERHVFIEELYEQFPFGAGLAWGSELIDTLDGNYFHHLESYGHEQRLHGKTTGGIGDYFVGIGANYNDKLHIGATLGISALNYTLESTYTETPTASNTKTFLTSWSEKSTLDISGRGLNIKLGLIYWIQEKMRIGLSYASGTSFLINERYVKNMEANWKDRDQTFANSPDGFNEYRYISPYNITLSYALVDKYIGSIDLDAEWVTYGRMKFDRVAGFPVDFTEVNGEINDNVGPALNLRVGGELLLGSFLLRGGGAVYGNPVKHKEFFNRYSISGGIGYRIKRATFDVAYSYLGSTTYETNIHYAKNIRLQPSTAQLHAHQLILTAGFKFIKLE